MSRWARVAPAGLASGGLGFSRCERRISEEEVRKHRSENDAWISFNGSVYDITSFIPRHPQKANWASRVAGRRFEHFLGRDAFGPIHRFKTDCSSADAKANLARILAPYRLGSWEPAAASKAAARWPEVDREDLRLRLERADGAEVRTFTLEDLKKMKLHTRRVTHKCTTSGNIKVQEWTGVLVRNLLPASEAENLKRESRGQSWEPLVTFVGMDGFGHSMFLSRALQDDVLLAFEQNGEALDVEQGGPLRLVKDGQHAKWVETVILE
ncbi:unnamed protein product [Effrenium voratum]|uniref:Cytochrome b5 heme-binding domain-containing protein n=1 Tax=Effrenium voratum TaxID=2562239 RepID=A0AA36J986_9DINO|nr:unnamed protein product [Effrenium voratum]